MIPDRRRIFIILNILVLSACVAAGLLLYAEAGKYAGKDTVYIAPKLNHPDYFFYMEEVEWIEEADEGGMISYERVENNLIKNGVTELYSKVIYTNNAYFAVNHMNFRDGGPWRKGHNKDNIVILSEYAAWYLFGSLDVVGKTVAIEGGLYEITGIGAQDRPGENAYFAWIPMGTGEASGLPNLLFKDFHYNRLSSMAQAKAILTGLEKNVQDYYITDLNQYHKNMLIKILVPLTIILSYLVFRGLICLCRDHTILSIEIPMAFLSGAGLYMLCKKIKGLMWITAQPFHLKSFYQIMTNTDVFPAQAYLSFQLESLVAMNNNTNTLFFISLICIANIIFLIRLPLAHC